MATIIVAVRASLLAQGQVEEVLAEIIKHHPHVHFKPLFIEVGSDLPERAMHEIGEALLKRRCSVAIYSVKDLVEPVNEELTLAAITLSKLAIVVRSDAHAMLKLFACIDTRQLQLQ